MTDFSQAASLLRRKLSLATTEQIGADPGAPPQAPPGAAMAPAGAPVMSPTGAPPAAPGAPPTMPMDPAAAGGMPVDPATGAPMDPSGGAGAAGGAPVDPMQQIMEGQQALADAIMSLTDQLGAINEVAKTMAAMQAETEATRKLVGDVVDFLNIPVPANQEIDEQRAKMDAMAAPAPSPADTGAGAVVDKAAIFVDVEADYSEGVATVGPADIRDHGYDDPGKKLSSTCKVARRFFQSHDNS